MARRKRSKSAAPTPAPPPATRPQNTAISWRDWGRRLEWICLASLVALMVATPLIPSESAAQHGTGVILVMLWFLLLPAWLLTRLASQPSPWRVGWTLVAVVALIAWHVVSGLVALQNGNPRFALNAIWQWGSFGAAFFLTRQLAPSGLHVRGLLSVMLGLAVTLAALGVYQYFVTLPQNRAAYEADPEGTLRRIGIDAPPGSIERRQVVDRLYSLEPTATFALTNSLAGFLAPMLILMAGLTLSERGRLRKDVGFALAAFLMAVLLGGCLLVTKSRTAFLAVAAGVALVALFQGAWFRRLGWPIALVGVLLATILLGVAVGTGGLDRQVLSEAPKSLLYRMEYWQATLQMIADSPWFGCGPGNFQTCYSAYKLPQASETVADPHNFLLEVWSTAGTPAAIALLAIGLVFASQLRSALGSRSGSESSEKAARGTEPPKQPNAQGRRSDGNGTQLDPESRRILAAIRMGAGFGLIIAFPIGWLVGFPLQVILLPLGLVGGGATILLLDRWVRDGRDDVWPLIAALIVLLINLSAAGGVSFPGVAQTGWLLLALALNFSSAGRIWTPRPTAVAAACLAAVLLVALCFVTLYYPVLESKAKLAGARQRLQDQNFSLEGRIVEAEQLVAAAATADRFASEPWTELARLKLTSLELGSMDALPDFKRAIAEAAGREPRSSSLQSRIGHWYLTIFRRTGNPTHLRSARDAYEKAVTLYPAGNMEWAQWAWADYLCGEREAAREHAEEALRLDGLNPHEERKLNARTLQADRLGLRPEPVDADAPNAPRQDSPVGTRVSSDNVPNAEQRMQFLRKLQE